MNTSSAAAWWWVTFPARETKWGFLSKSRKLEESSETSSLGNLNEDEDDEEDNVVSSSGGGGNNIISTNTGFGSLGSLEGSLPIKSVPDENPSFSMETNKNRINQHNNSHELIFPLFSL